MTVIDRLRLISRSDGRTYLIQAFGELDVYSARALAKAVSHPLTLGSEEVSLDLRGIDLIDSTGLAVLLDVKRRIVSKGGRLRLACSAAVLRPMSIAGLDSSFEIVPELEG